MINLKMVLAENPTKFTYKLQNLSQALDRLQEAVNQQHDAYVQDSVIKRFEFTFGLAWKLLKLIIHDEYQPNTPGAIIKRAYNEGYIKDYNTWVNMLKNRNTTSHEYSSSKSEEIYIKIKQEFYDCLKSFHDEVKNELKIWSNR